MKWLMLAIFWIWAASSHAACVIETNVVDVIGPATVDLLKRVDDYATQENCSAVLLNINTPGGSLESTRIIVEMILNSSHPYLCLVSPSGGHAGSAGAIILQGCHVNGALTGTNLGAATPVALGQDLPKDLRQKIMNDTRSWLESLTRLRGRSDKFGKDIILEAKAVTAEEALRLKAIDKVAVTKDDFLQFTNGRTVRMKGDVEEKVETGSLKEFPLDTRYQVLSLLTDPQLAYLMMMGSLALLYFEITHPGTVVAGVAGGMGLVISMIALHKLDVEWGGLLLIFLGIGLLIAEMFLPTFGVLGVGGVASFILGSLFLFDPVKSYGYRLPWALILPVVAFLALSLIGVSLLFLRTRRVKKKGGFEDLVGHHAKVVSLDQDDKEGMIELQGELWKFMCHSPVTVGDHVKVNGHHGLVLRVEKE